MRQHDAERFTVVSQMSTVFGLVSQLGHQPPKLAVEKKQAGTEFDIDKMQARLDSPEYARIKQSLREIGIYSAVDLVATYAGNANDLKPWTQDASINRDRNLRLQYLAGMSLNTYKADPIYVSMTSHARYPENLFTGSQQTMDALRRAIRFPAAK